MTFPSFLWTNTKLFFFYRDCFRQSNSCPRSVFVSVGPHFYCGFVSFLDVLYASRRATGAGAGFVYGSGYHSDADPFSSFQFIRIFIRTLPVKCETKNGEEKMFWTKKLYAYLLTVVLTQPIGLSYVLIHTVLHLCQDFFEDLITYVPVLI